MECCEAKVVDTDEATTWQCDTKSPVPAFLMSQLDDEPDLPSAIGIFRRVERPVYDDQVQQQVDAVTERKGPGTLKDLIYTPDCWTVE